MTRAVKGTDIQQRTRVGGWGLGDMIDENVRFSWALLVFVEVARVILCLKWGWFVIYELAELERWRSCLVPALSAAYMEQMRASSVIQYYHFGLLVAS